jgi:ABC-type antimicrobial peptide transport system permease subunit
MIVFAVAQPFRPARRPRAGLRLAAARLVRHLLYGSAESDWVFYASAAAVVAVVGLIASLLPARRAAAVEPLVALQCD